MFCAAHSIGGILLDKEEIANTQILIQATEKENVDWDIMIDYIKLGCPYQNAYIERFNRTYRDDVLNCYIFNNLNEVKQITEDWIELYNNERPHDSLNDCVINGVFIILVGGATLLDFVKICNG